MALPTTDVVLNPRMQLEQPAVSNGLPAAVHTTTCLLVLGSEVSVPKVAYNAQFLLLVYNLEA